MTFTEHAPTLEDRRTTLRWLARHWGDIGRAVQEIMLCATVHESMDDRPLLCGNCTCGICLACTWDAYLGDLDLMDGFGTGHDWRDVNDEAASAEAAWDEITERVGGLEDLLLRGVSARGLKAAPAAPRETGQAA